MHLGPIFIQEICEESGVQVDLSLLWVTVNFAGLACTDSYDMTLLHYFVST